MILIVLLYTIKLKAMKDKIKTIIKENFSSEIRSQEVVSLINGILLDKAKECLTNNDVHGHKAVISLFIEL